MRERKSAKGGKTLSKYSYAFLLARSWHVTDSLSNLLLSFRLLVMPRYIVPTCNQEIVMSAPC